MGLVSEELSDNATSNVSEESLLQAASAWWGPHWHPHSWGPHWHPGFHGWHHWGHGPHWHHWLVSEELSDNATSNVSEESLLQAAAAWWGPHWHPWYASEAMLGEIPEFESNESALSEALIGNV